MEGSLFGIENERRSFTASSVKDGMESIKSKLDFLSNEQNAPFLSSFFIDLIHRIKNTLGTIRDYTKISRGKFSDKEFGEYFYRAVTEDVEKIDMVLDGLINYIKLNTPIRKTDTVHHLIEEVLKDLRKIFLKPSFRMSS
jgi:nitrogen-specific signal transduction histidine kinase